MLYQSSEQIRKCHAHAAEARRRAAETSDPERKEDYMLAEQGWLRLADSYALSERIEHYLLEQDCKLARGGEWQPVSVAPFDRDLEIAVINSAIPHALAFPCRRILGGWMDATTKDRLEVQPTHWREWSRRSIGVDGAGLRAPSTGRPRESEDPARDADPANGVETSIARE